MRRDIGRQLRLLLVITLSGAVLASCGLVRVIDLRRESQRRQRLYEMMLRRQIETLEREVETLPPEYAEMLRPKIERLRQSVNGGDT